MEYNICENCGADGGRAGNLFYTRHYPYFICESCKSTLDVNALVLHNYLPRHDHEVKNISRMLDPAPRLINNISNIPNDIKFEFLFVEGNRIHYFNKESGIFINGELTSKCSLGRYVYRNDLVDLIFVQLGYYPGFPKTKRHG